MLRMLGSRALVARLAPRHQATRHKGILSSFKESIDKEMKKNPELQKTLDELREGAAPLAKGAQEAASKLSSAAAEGASQAAIVRGEAPAAVCGGVTEWCERDVVCLSRGEAEPRLSRD